MKTTIDLFSYSCVGCGKCIRVCAKDVLKLVDNGKIRFINVAHAEACDRCRSCEEVCRHHAIRIVNEHA